MSLIALWGFCGYCGSVPLSVLLMWLLRWKNPPPPPDPWPIIRTIGIIGGIAGGLAYNQAFPIEGIVTAASVASTVIGAFLGSIFLSDLYVMGRTMVARSREQKTQTV